MTLPTTYRTAEVAAAFKISVDTLRDLVKAGKVTPLRLSDSPYAEMRFTEANVAELEHALKPPVSARKRRRKRAPGFSEADHADELRRRRNQHSP